MLQTSPDNLKEGNIETDEEEGDAKKAAYCYDGDNKTMLITMKI